MGGWRALASASSASEYRDTTGGADPPYAMMFECEWPDSGSIDDMLANKQKFVQDEK